MYVTVLLRTYCGPQRLDGAATSNRQGKMVTPTPIAALERLPQPYAMQGKIEPRLVALRAECQALVQCGAPALPFAAPWAPARMRSGSSCGTSSEEDLSDDHVSRQDEIPCCISELNAEPTRQMVKMRKLLNQHVDMEPLTAAEVTKTVLRVASQDLCAGVGCGQHGLSASLAADAPPGARPFARAENVPARLHKLPLCPHYSRPLGRTSAPSAPAANRAEARAPRPLNALAIDEEVHRLSYKAREVADAIARSKCERRLRDGDVAVRGGRARTGIDEIPAPGLRAIACAHLSGGLPARPSVSLSISPSRPQPTVKIREPQLKKAPPPFSLGTLRSVSRQEFLLQALSNAHDGGSMPSRTQSTAQCSASFRTRTTPMPAEVRKTLKCERQEQLRKTPMCCQCAKYPVQVHSHTEGEQRRMQARLLCVRAEAEPPATPPFRARPIPAAVVEPKWEEMQRADESRQGRIALNARMLKNQARLPPRMEAEGEEDAARKLRNLDRARAAAHEPYTFKPCTTKVRAKEHILSRQHLLI